MKKSFACESALGARITLVISHSSEDTLTGSSSWEARAEVFVGPTPVRLGWAMAGKGKRIRISESVKRRTYEGGGARRDDGRRRRRRAPPRARFSPCKPNVLWFKMSCIGGETIGAK